MPFCVAKCCELGQLALREKLARALDALSAMDFLATD
jgi:hypothetical protein